jgi:hypothetical protein
MQWGMNENELSGSKCFNQQGKTVSFSCVLAVERDFGFRHWTDITSISDTEECGHSKPTFLTLLLEKLNYYSSLFQHMCKLA